MIKAEFQFKPKTNDITHVRISGHAGQNTYGHDIVCASVSSLMIATINGLENYVGISTNAIVKEGFTEFSVNTADENQALQAQTLAHTFYKAMLGLQEENKKFIEVTTMEEKI